MSFQRAAAWGQLGIDGRAQRDEERVRRDFWAQGEARRGPAAVRRGAARRLLLRLRPGDPGQVKAALFGALAYFVLPFDFVPDMLPFLGFTDDAAVLLTALRMVSGTCARSTRGARC